MVNKNSEQYYILMADVVRSREMNGEEMMLELKELVSIISKQNQKAFLSPMTITLGDEFQSIVKNVDRGVNLLIQMEEKIIELDLRIKLRYVFIKGSIDTPINSKNAHEMYGDGFIQARYLLSELKKRDRRFQFEFHNQKSNLFNSVFYLYSSLIDNWKSEDYKMIISFIQEKDYYSVAKKMKINRGTTWRKERSLEIRQYLEIKKLINNIVNYENYSNSSD